MALSEMKKGKIKMAAPSACSKLFSHGPHISEDYE